MTAPHNTALRGGQQPARRHPHRRPGYRAALAVARGGPAVAVSVACLAIALALFDNLVTAPLPALRHDLDATGSQLLWSVYAYTAAFVVTMIAGVSLRRRLPVDVVFAYGALLGIAAAATAALAPTVPWLVGLRAAQGAANACLVPAAVAVLVVPCRAARGKGLSLVAGLVALVVAALPVVVCSLSSAPWAWRALLWANVPVGVVFAVVAGLWILSQGAALELEREAAVDAALRRPVGSGAPRPTVPGAPGQVMAPAR